MNADRAPQLKAIVVLLSRANAGFVSQRSIHNRMFLRFAVTQIDEDSRKPQGVFVAAYALLDSCDLDVEESKRLRELLDWFHENLPSPPEDFYASRAIFWFKSSAHESFNRIWELVQQSLAADGAITCFLSNLVPLSLNADRAAAEGHRCAANDQVKTMRFLAPNKITAALKVLMISVACAALGYWSVSGYVWFRLSDTKISISVTQQSLAADGAIASSSSNLFLSA